MYFLYTLSPAYSGLTITSQTGAELLEFRITLEYLGSWISWQRRCRGNFKLPKTHEIELFREVKYYCKNSIFPGRCFGRFERWRERQVLKGLAQLEWIFKELIAFLFTFAASQQRNLKSFWGHKCWLLRYPSHKRHSVIKINMSHSQMLGKVESGGGPIFKVVLEC